jgi:hypothetical protein
MVTKVAKNEYGGPSESIVSHMVSHAQVQHLPVSSMIGTQPSQCEIEAHFGAGGRAIRVLTIDDLGI